MEAEARSSRVPPVTLIEPNLSGVPPAVATGQCRGPGPPLHIKTDSRLWLLCRARHKSHTRRKFYDIYAATQSPLAEEALRQIAALYEIEDKIRGQPAEHRTAVREAESKPLMEALNQRLFDLLKEISVKSKMAKAIRYTLGHWNGLTLFLTDGRVEVDSNTIERTMRSIATPGSLCTSSSSIWKHWKLIAGIDVTRASFTPDRLRHGRRVQVRGPDLERRAGNNLLGAKGASLDQLAYPVAGNAAVLSCLAQGQPGPVLLGGLVVRMPRTRRIEPTRCAVQVLPCPVGRAIRLRVAAMS